MKISKLRQDREVRIKERIQKICRWEAYEYLKTHLSFAEDNKEKEMGIIKNKLEDTNKVIEEIRKLTKDLKKYIPNVLEQNKLTAIYLLITKSLFDLESLLLLISEGFSFQAFNIARSANEALDLTFLFIEDEDEHNLKEWFKGEIIPNEKARKATDRVINSGVLGNIQFPVYELKRDVYDIYSEFTHSAYGAILDLVDPFHKDLDFRRLTGYHFSLKYFDITILNLEFNILLALKNVFIYLSEEKLISEIDNLLVQFDKLKASKDEIGRAIKNYE